SLSRRALLRALGAASLGLLGACAPSGQPTPTSAPAPAQPTTAPAAPAQPTGAPQQPTTAPAAVSTAPARATGQAVKLRYALWDQAFLPIVEPMFKEFSARNPTITVEPEIQPFADHFTKLQREFAGGNAADVFHLNPANAAAFAYGKQLLPLDDRLKKDDFVKEAVDMYQYLDGKLYAVPFYIDSMGVAFNEDLFARAKLPTPKELQAQGKWDWPTFRETALALSSGDGPQRVHGFAARNDGQGGYFNFIFANDGELWNQDVTRTAMDSPPVMEAIQFMADMILKDRSSPDPQALQSQDHLTRFYNQQLAMLPAGSFNVINLRKNATGFKWDVERFPKGKKQVGFIAGLVHGIYARSANADAAWELVKYMSAREQIRKWGTEGVGVPALKSEAGAFASPPPANINAFVDAINGARANRQNVEIDKTGVPLGVRDSVVVAGRGREIGEVFAGRKSVEDAMKTLAAEMNKALEETKA
ncbi:MAG: extracellular solute-binding protein, partial [Chloroflexota bacterium]|nr:extracellular solute-binding protein [Chloroflexota bacterium]